MSFFKSVPQSTIQAIRLLAFTELAELYKKHMSPPKYAVGDTVYTPKGELANIQEVCASYDVLERAVDAAIPAKDSSVYLTPAEIRTAVTAFLNTLLVGCPLKWRYRVSSEALLVDEGNLISPRLRGIERDAAAYRSARIELSDAKRSLNEALKNIAEKQRVYFSYMEAATKAAATCHEEPEKSEPTSAGCAGSRES